MPIPNARRAVCAAAIAACLLAVGDGAFALASPIGTAVEGARTAEASGAAAPTPRRPREDVRPLAAGTVALLALLAAAGVAASIAWKRAVGEKRAALREAERWQGLAQRRMRETRWRGLADHAGSSVVCLEGHRIVGANLGAAQELGQADGAGLVGGDFMAFVAAADRELLAACLEDRVAQGGGAATLVMRLKTDDGRTFPAEVTAAAAREFDETVVYVSWREAPPRRQAEAVLETVAAALPLALVVTDTDGNLAWANSALFERTGYDGRRFAGRPLLPIVEAPYRRAVMAALASARRGRVGGGFALLRCAGGDTLTAEFKAFPVRGGQQRAAVLFVGSEMAAPGEGKRDVAATARDRALSQLGTYLAHKVSNDSQALLGILEELDAGGQAPGSLMTARRLAAGTVDDLRRFVSLSRGGVGAPRPVRLWKLIERWREMTASTLPPKVRLATRCEVDGDRVMADAGLIVLWLEVSLAAAVAAMELGGAIEVSLREGGAPGSLRLVFADTGFAAAAAAAGTGEHFFPRDTAHALADLIAVRHGGRAQAGRADGIGGRSWIEFPVHSVAGSGKEVAAPRLREGVILVADDEDMVRTTLAAALRAVGYEVVEARNGFEAVESVRSAPERFALVVLDLVMPVMDGREALRHLRESAPGVPVVVCTGYDPVGDEALAAAGLLIKPFSIVDLLEKVAELTGRSGRETQVVR